MGESKAYTITDIARASGVTVASVSKYIKREQLKPVKAGQNNAKFFSNKDFEDIVAYYKSKRQDGKATHVQTTKDDVIAKQSETIELLKKQLAEKDEQIKRQNDQIDNLTVAVDNIGDLTKQVAFFESIGKEYEAKRLYERVTYDMEMIRELGYCPGIENYSRHLTGLAPGEAPPCLIDYLPSDALMFFDESHVMLGQLGGMYRGDRSRKETLVNYGFRLPSALDNRPLRFDEFERKMRRSIFVSATPAEWELKKSSQIVEQVVRPTGLVDPEVEVRPATTQVDDVLSEISERTKVGDRVLVTTLTKRMAEELTEFLSEHNVKVRYLHSDIDTVERVEIIRDLRAGVFDVLVGINLLREGLDIPEVSLVAILDADKEGFLRSTRSLIQTIGRAARNVHGKAILYADKMTDSMKEAIGETERRRAKQQDYNKEHGITPRSVVKEVREIIDGVYKGPDQAKKESAVVFADVNPDDEKSVAKRIKETEKKMLECAKNLDFEQAAMYRDRLEELKKLVFGSAGDGL